MRLILNRLRTALDGHLSETQHGFRPGRNTVQALALFATRRLVEELHRLQPGETVPSAPCAGGLHQSLRF
eukprot:10331566-Prorocentrum_lima.AAC.1